MMHGAFGRFCLPLTLLLLAGCVTIKPAPTAEVVSQQHVSDKNYTLGRPLEAVVGTDVIRVKDYSVTNLALNQVEVTSDFAFEHTMFSHQFKRGEIYPFAGTIEYEKKTYNLMRVGPAGIMFDDNGVIFNKIVNGIGVPNLPSPVVMVYQFDPLPPGQHVRRLMGQSQDRTAGAVNYEIIFSGISADSIRFSYREFSPDDLARPAFSQELTYPIRSKQIRFRDLVIDLNEVTADHVNFTVVSDGSPPPAPPAPKPGI